MAVRDYALTPKGMLSGVHRIAPEIEVITQWRWSRALRGPGGIPEPDFLPDGEGIYDFWLHVGVVVDGELVEAQTNLDDYLSRDAESSLFDTGDPFHRIFEDALIWLHRLLYRSNFKRSRKMWDPREAALEPERTAMISKVRDAVDFMRRSANELFFREKARRKRQRRAAR